MDISHGETALEERGCAIVTLQRFNDVSKRLEGTACLRAHRELRRIRHKMGGYHTVSTDVLYKEPKGLLRVCEEWVALPEDKLEFGGGQSVLSTSCQVQPQNLNIPTALFV